MRYLRSPLILLLAGLAACQQQAATSPPTEAVAADPVPATVATQVPEEIETSAPGAPVGSLAGAWRVAGIDGESFDEPYGLALTGNQTELWWEPRCAGMARSYTIIGRSVSFAATGSPSSAVCDIGLPPRLNDVFRALDAANTVVRTPANGIEISGGGHSVTLFSQ